MTLRLGGDGAITGCTSLENPDLTVSGLTISGSFDAEKVLVASGTAAAPSYTFSGDTDNGLYYAGTNSIGLSTGGTNAILIDSSGRVGIGTTSPSEKLEIIDDTNTDVFGGIKVLSNNQAAYVKYGWRGIDGIDELRFSVGDTERARIDSSGNVGIGTQSPSNLLDVASTVGDGIRIGSAVAGTITRETEGLRITGASTTKAISFVTAGSEAMRVDTSGRLLVGTSSAVTTVGGSSGGSTVTPEVQIVTSGSDSGLFVNRTEAFAANVYLGSGSNGNAVANDSVLGILHFQGYSAAASTFRSAARILCEVDGEPDTAGDTTDMPGRLVFSTTANGASSPTERMRIDSSGRLLLNSGSDVRMELGTNGTTGTNDRNHVRGDGDNMKYNCCADGIHVFEQNGTERARIDSSGRLLVGTSSTPGSSIASTALIQVQGRAGFSSDYSVINARAGYTPSSADAALGFLTFCDSNNNIGAWITAYSDGGAWTSGSNHRSRLVFSTTADGASSPTERMRIQNNGNLRCFTEASNQFVSARTIASQGVFSIRTGGSDVLGTGGTSVFIVRADGDAENSNGTFTTISDAKFKENVVDAQSQWDDLRAIQIRNFNFTAKTGWSSHKQIGVVAQEVEQVCPSLVKEVDSTDSDETYKTVKTSILYMKAVKALQEAMERIEQLEAKVAALEAR